jgi:hypothetical protein
LKKIFLFIIAIISLSVLSITTIGETSGQASADTEVPLAFLTNPIPDNITNQQNPVITIQIIDESTIDHSQTVLLINELDVSDWDETVKEQNSISHEVPEIFTLKDGNHTITLVIVDEHGNGKEYTWTFEVDKDFKEPEEEIDYFRLFIIGTIILVILVIIGLISSVLYLKVTKAFNFIKFYKRHPIDKEKVLLYLPMAVGGLIIIGAIL